MIQCKKIHTLHKFHDRPVGNGEVYDYIALEYIRLLLRWTQSLEISFKAILDGYSSVHSDPKPACCHHEP